MWPFKPKPDSGLSALVFKTGEDFIDYHCKYMTTRLERDSPLAAVVIDATGVFGTSVPVKRDERGIQTATLRVASDDGGFIVVAQTASGGGDDLKPGDAVAWIPMQHMPQIAAAADDERTGWMGLIVAKIAPEIDMTKDEMTVICRY